jgi:hypothetical protein
MLLGKFRLVPDLKAVQTDTLCLVNGSVYLLLQLVPCSTALVGLQGAS